MANIILIKRIADCFISFEFWIKNSVLKYDLDDSFTLFKSGGTDFLLLFLDSFGLLIGHSYVIEEN